MFLKPPIAEEIGAILAEKLIINRRKTIKKEFSALPTYKKQDV